MSSENIAMNYNLADNMHQYALMCFIDKMDTDRDTSMYGKVTIEVYNMPRDTYDFYMRWIAQTWYYSGIEYTAPEVVTDAMRMLCVSLMTLARV